METDDLHLDEQLCVALYDASRAMTGCYRPLLAELGLTYSQYVVLLVLWDEDSIGMADLGDRLHLDSGTLSPLLKRLETAGLVARRRRKEDERTVEVALLEAGRALRPATVDVQRRVVEATGLEPEELAALRDRLVALTGDLRAAREELVDAG